MQRVLVVEDSPTQAQQLQLLLEEGGYQVETANDGEQGLHRFLEQPFDMVLSDVQMPRLSGPELCRRIKEHPHGRHIPVVLVTVHRDPGVALEGLESGADYFVSKPFEAEGVISLVKEILDNYTFRSTHPYRMGEGHQVEFGGRTFATGEDTERAVDYLVSALGEFARIRDKLVEQAPPPQALENWKPVQHLAQGIAQHMNNHLCAIMGYASLLSMSLKPGNPLNEDLDQIREAAKQVAVIARHLQQYSRQAALKPESVDLNRMLEKSLPILQDTAGGSVELKIVQNQDCWKVWIDRILLQQIIMELVRNAREAMPAGGELVIETANMDLGLEAMDYFPDVVPGRYVAILVRDNGEGMDHDTLQRLFEPFHSTKSQEEHAGLGLAAAYGLIRQSGGHMLVHSKEGAGTVVHVLVPAGQENVVEGPGEWPV